MMKHNESMQRMIIHGYLVLMALLVNHRASAFSTPSSSTISRGHRAAFFSSSTSSSPSTTTALPMASSLMNDSRFQSLNPNPPIVVGSEHESAPDQGGISGSSLVSPQQDINVRPTRILEPNHPERKANMLSSEGGARGSGGGGGVINIPADLQ